MKCISLMTMSQKTNGKPPTLSCLVVSLGQKAMKENIKSSMFLGIARERCFHCEYFKVFQPDIFCLIGEFASKNMPNAE